MGNDELNSLLDMGQRLVRSGKLPEARAFFVRAVKADPKSAAAWYWLGAVIDDPEKKKYCLDRAATIDPGIAQKESQPVDQPAAPAWTFPEDGVDEAGQEQAFQPFENRAMEFQLQEVLVSEDVPAENLPVDLEELELQKATPGRRKVPFLYFLVGLVLLLALIMIGFIAWMFTRGMVGF